MWFQPQRLLALQHGLKLWKPKLSTPPDTHRPSPPPSATTGATAGTEQRAIEHTQHPHLPAAARANKPAPTAAIGEPSLRHANGLLDIAEPDEELRRLGADFPTRPQPRDGKARQIVLKNPSHKLLGRTEPYPSQEVMDRASRRRTPANASRRARPHYWMLPTTKPSTTIL